MVGHSGVPVRPKNCAELACCFNMYGLETEGCSEWVGEGGSEWETAQDLGVEQMRK